MLKPYQINAQPMMQKSNGDPALAALGGLAGTAIGTALAGPLGGAVGAQLGSSLGGKGDLSGVTPEGVALGVATAGLGAGVDKAAGGLDAAKASLTDTVKSGVTSGAGYDAAVKGVQDAGRQVMSAQGIADTAKGSMFADPTNQMQHYMNKGYNAIFKAEGGEVKPKSQEIKRDKDGNYILPADFDFSKLQRTSESEQQQRASVDQQAKPVYKAQGGPLCSQCGDVEYKACGGMSKKRY